MCRISSKNRRRTDGKKPRPKSSRKKTSFGQLSSAEESDSDTSGRIVVGHLNSRTISANIVIAGSKYKGDGVEVKLATHTGISKTLLNRGDWESPNVTNVVDPRTQPLQKVTRHY